MRNLPFFFFCFVCFQPDEISTANSFFKYPVFNGGKFRAMRNMYATINVLLPSINIYTRIVDSTIEFKNL